MGNLEPSWSLVKEVIETLETTWQLLVTLFAPWWTLPVSSKIVHLVRGWAISSFMNTLTVFKWQPDVNPIQHPCGKWTAEYRNHWPRARRLQVRLPPLRKSLRCARFWQGSFVGTPTVFIHSPLCSLSVGMNMGTKAGQLMIPKVTIEKLDKWNRMRASKTHPCQICCSCMILTY